MKQTMKTALALLLTLAVLLVPMSMVVSAESGTYEDPFLLSANSVRFYVYVEPAETVYVQVDDCNNSVVNVGYATSDTYMIMYGVQPVYPNGDVDNTASFTMNPMSNMFSVYNTGEEAVSVYMSLTAGAPAEVETGTMDNPEELTLSDPWGMGMLSAYAEQALDAGNQGRYYKVIAPAEGILNVGVFAYDPETWDNVGWLYSANNLTQGKYGDNHWSDDEPVVDTERVAVQPGDEVHIFVTTYDPANMFLAPAGTIGVNVSFSALGSYDCPVTPAEGANVSVIENGNGYFYTWTATELSEITVTMNDADGWQYNISKTPADVEDYASYIYGDTHFADDTPVVASESMVVKPGETVQISVNTYDPASPWGGPSGSVNWTFSVSTDVKPVAGDVNDDYMLTIRDVVLVLNAINGNGTLTEAQAAIADVNGNGVVNFADAVRLFYAVNGAVTL